MNETIKKLRAKFKESEIEWRPQSQGLNGEKPWILVIPYIQARCIQNRLDEVFGFDGWQVEYRNMNQTTNKNDSDNNIICRISVKTENGWIYKEDGAAETNIEAFKGGISSALKRCASSGFGIGRYLYDLKPVYADCKLEKVTGWNKSSFKKDNKYITIYWKTPKLEICEVIDEPIGEDTPEIDTDLDIFLGLECCTSADELKKYCAEHKSNVKDMKALVKKYNERLAAINGNN